MSFEPPDIRTPERPKRVLGWVEIIMSSAALFVSFVSIGIALHHGRIMKQLVTANSYPYVEGGRSNASPSGEPRLSVDLMNQGVGPAHERSLRITLDGRYVRSIRDLMAQVFGEAGAAEAERLLNPYANVVETRFIAPGGRQPVFQIVRTQENAAQWDRLDQAMRTMTVEFCYCSVFDECWDVYGNAREPVEECVRDPEREFTP